MNFGKKLRSEPLETDRVKWQMAKVLRHNNCTCDDGDALCEWRRGCIALHASGESRNLARAAQLVREMKSG